MELLPALQRPADFDEALALSRCAALPTANPLQQQAHASSQGQEGQQEAAAPSVMHALTALNTQCTVFQRCAKELGEGY